MRPLRFFVVAGEASGDLHASNLIKAIRRREPDAEIAGLGGPLMREAGCHLLHNLVEKFDIMWFWKACWNLHNVYRFQKDTLRYIDAEETRPDVVILIDYPGFNLTLGRWLRKRTIPVAYYIAPQVWAWFPWRIRKIGKRVDRMIVILPFEVNLYRQKNIPVSYVGHPIIDSLQDVSIDESFRERLGLAADEKLVGILPGSRDQEVRRLLPLMLAVARLMKDEYPKIRFLVPVRQARLAPFVDEILSSASVAVERLEDRVYETMKFSDLCLVSSGTATLELAHFLTPMVVLYRISPLSYLISKPFMRTKHIGLVNILAGREIVPDMLLYRNRPDKVARAALDLLLDEPRRQRAIDDLRVLREKIDEPGASDRAAAVILEMASHSRQTEPTVRKIIRKKVLSNESL